VSVALALVPFLLKESRFGLEPSFPNLLATLLFPLHRLGFS